MSYMVDKAPPEDKILQRQLRAWEPKNHAPNLTATRSAFKTYSTYVNEIAEKTLSLRANKTQDEEQVRALAACGGAEISGKLSKLRGSVWTSG